MRRAPLMQAADRAWERGVLLSFDVNHRAQSWSDHEAADALRPLPRAWWLEGRTRMSTIEDALHARGLAFRTERPQRRFVDAKQTGDLVYLSGHGPEDEHGRLPWTGKVGRDLTVEEGYQAARRVAVNCLGTLKLYLGELDRIDEVIKVLGFVNSAPDFHRQPEVMHGFTDLLLEVMGERGRHARSAIGTNDLPNDQPVEVEMIVKVRT